MSTRLRAVVAVTAVGLVLQGCALHGLSFVRDERVSIADPTSNETVSLPFEVRWDVEGYEGRFAVVFDRAPMRPDRTLRSFVPEDDPCRTRPDCPDEVWLLDHDVYVTDGTSIEVETLPDRRSTNRAKDRHLLTVVLIDDAGRRIGESAFSREFIVERED